MQMLPEHQLPVPLQTKRYSLTHGMSWQVLRELHWAGYTCSFPADPRGLWQAAAPPLHEPWHEECHRAQSFHHFYLISMQNLQGIWWSIWAAMPAIRLMICSFMYLSPLIQMALSQISWVLKARAAWLAEAEGRDSSEAGWKWETLQSTS